VDQEIPINVAGPGPELEFTPARELPPPACTYTVSARQKPVEMPVFAYLRNQYGNLPLREIESLFGFVERSTLYGGRFFTQRELSDRDVFQLNNAGIGIRIPLSNHQVSREEYEANRPLLEKYHREINSIICTQDDLARWVRADYPAYRLDASVIKNLNTHAKIDEALEIYDSVVLPMYLNHDLAFLEKIERKERITLFANAGCAFTCPSKICYTAISKMNKFTGEPFACSQATKQREIIGMVDFDLAPLIQLGFHQFKLLRARPGSLTGF
jgi:hypothetical protein